jgi:predicted Zn-dependent protease with MMP-like domain
VKNLNMPELEPPEEEIDNNLETDSDERILTSDENKARANYFFAALCFLFAVICLSILINNYLNVLASSLLLLGIAIFGLMGILFVWQKSFLNHTVNSWMHTQKEETEGVGVEVEEQENEAEDVAVGMEEQQEAELDEDEDEDEVEEELISFKLLVEQALSSIPPEFQQMMENLVILVESEPGEELLKRMDVEEGHTLFGLYEGAPLTAWGRGGARLPERITIFQHPIEAYCRKNPDRIRDQVRRTVLHEVAHHFGIDHEEMPIWIK